MDLQMINQQVSDALRELLAAAHLKKGDLFVVGCSTSEIGGHLIGTQSSEEIAKAVMDAVLPAVREQGAFLAVQCCEHLNRALVVEREALTRYGLTEVWVTPWLHAGGAFAMQATSRFQSPAMAEDLKGLAAAGMDIGGTFIGMHLRPVAVPLHTTHRRVGEATLTMARTRPKYIGGPRARYEGFANGH